MTKDLWQRLRLPVIGAPMFLVSGPALVVAQCKAGIVGAFPALNARPASQLDEWLHQITEELAAWDRDNPTSPSAPFAVNQIVHRSNSRLDQDLALCAKWKVPITISSLGALQEVNSAVHEWGGITLHDVISDLYARKAVERGADGLIAVAAGAGGHAGPLSPFALVQEIRQWFTGTLVLSGSIATGRAILAARAMGADLAYVGTAFIATREARAQPAYKKAVVSARAEDIIYSSAFTGVPGNFLRPAIIAAGFDPDRLPVGKSASLSFAGEGRAQAKIWKDVWSAGQGVGAVQSILPAGKLINELRREYEEAIAQLAPLQSV